MNLNYQSKERYGLKINIEINLISTLTSL